MEGCERGKEKYDNKNLKNEQKKKKIEDVEGYEL